MSMGRNVRMMGGYEWEDYCEYQDREVTHADCVRCDLWGVWRKGDAARCKLEYDELVRDGYYDLPWEEYLRKADPETWKELEEEKKTRERVNRELEEEFRRVKELREQIKKEEDEEDDEEPGAWSWG